MTTGASPASDVARPQSELTDAQKKERAERILNARKLGQTTELICAVFNLPRTTVLKVMAAARQHGDARALTDKQASAVSRALTMETVSAAARVNDEAARRAPQTVNAARLRALEMADFCAARAEEYAAHPHVAAGLGHLGDLYREHGPQFYRDYQLKDGGELNSLAFLPRAGVDRTLSGSPAASCFGE